MFQSRNVSLWNPRSVTASMVVPMMPSDWLDTWMSRSGVQKSSATSTLYFSPTAVGEPIGRAPYCACATPADPASAITDAIHTKTTRLIVVINSSAPGVVLNDAGLAAGIRGGRPTGEAPAEYHTACDRPACPILNLS